MPKIKPSNIRPSDAAYSNLAEELIDIRNKIKNGDASGIKSEITKLANEVGDLRKSTSDADSVINQELSTAKGPYSSINDRFLALDKYDILNTIGTVTTNRTYEYSNKGYITKESVRGDINYDTIYSYDSYDNVISKIKTDLNGNIVSEKYYTYDSNGNLASTTGTNTDDILLLSNALVDNDQNERLNQIEAIDFVELGKVLDGWDLIGVAETVQELVTQVQHLMLNLPENIGYLIDTSEVFRRIDTIEKRLDANEIYHAFDVSSSIPTYTIPDGIVGLKFGVFMEGLLLEKDVDYVITGNKITFNIPLIDGFTVTYKD